MKNLYLAILLLIIFTVKLFASDNKPVLTKDIQLDILYLYGLMSATSCPCIWQAIAEATTDFTASFVFDDVEDSAEANMDKICCDNFMDKLPDIRAAILNDIEAKMFPLEHFSLDRLAEIYSKVIDRLKSSFDDERYNSILDDVKIFYVISLARIFPKEVFFQTRPEFKLYNEKYSCVAISKNIEQLIILPEILCYLIGEYACCY